MLVDHLRVGVAKEGTDSAKAKHIALSLLTFCWLQEYACLLPLTSPRPVLRFGMGNPLYRWTRESWGQICLVSLESQTSSIVCPGMRGDRTGLRFSARRVGVLALAIIAPLDRPGG